MPEWFEERRCDGLYPRPGALRPDPLWLRSLVFTTRSHAVSYSDVMAAQLTMRMSVMRPVVVAQQVVRPGRQFFSGAALRVQTAAAQTKTCRRQTVMKVGTPRTKFTQHGSNFARVHRGGLGWLHNRDIELLFWRGYCCEHTSRWNRRACQSQRVLARRSL